MQAKCIRKSLVTALLSVLVYFFASAPYAEATMPCVLPYTPFRGNLKSSPPGSPSTITYYPSQPQQRMRDDVASNASQAHTDEDTVAMPGRQSLANRGIVVTTSPGFMTDVEALTTGSPTPTYTWTESTLPTITTYWAPQTATREDGLRYTTWIEVIFTAKFTQPVHGWTVDTSGATELAPPATELRDGKPPKTSEIIISWRPKKNSARNRLNVAFGLAISVLLVQELLILVEAV